MGLKSPFVKRRIESPRISEAGSAPPLSELNPRPRVNIPRPDIRRPLYPQSKFAPAQYISDHDERILFNDRLWNGYQSYFFYGAK